MIELAVPSQGIIEEFRSKKHARIAAYNISNRFNVKVYLAENGVWYQTWIDGLRYKG